MTYPRGRARPNPERVSGRHGAVAWAAALGPLRRPDVVIEVRRAADEVVGLAASFLQAGAAGVIASLWPVYDHATFLLMCRFLQLWLDPIAAGLPPAASQLPSAGSVRSDQ